MLRKGMHTCLLAACFTDVSAQVAIRSTGGVFYLTDQIPLTALLLEDGRIEPGEFVQMWKSLPESHETKKELPIRIANLEVVTNKIKAANIFLMAHKQVRRAAKFLHTLIV